MYALIFANDLNQSPNISEPLRYQRKQKNEMPVLQKAFPKFFTNRAGPVLFGLVYFWVLVWITYKLAVFAGKMPGAYSQYAVFVTLNVLLIVFEWVKWFVRFSYVSYTSVPLRRFVARLFNVDDSHHYRMLLRRGDMEDADASGDIDSRSEYMNIYTRDTIITLMNGFQIATAVYGTMGGYGMNYQYIPQIA
jgi:hypothetical protein